MELKYNNTFHFECISSGSNRTFMELKLMILFYAVFFFFCSNRTFMELKWAFISSCLRSINVLIVPLWN